MDRFLFWQRWLFAVGVLITVFGIFMAFFSGTAIFKVFDTSINTVFWGTETVNESTMSFQRWIYGTWGATIAGWGIFVVFIAYYPFRQKEKWSWNCSLLGLLFWYLIDTGFSTYYGVYINVALNTIFLILVILPLFFTWSDFHSE